jgi:hypothetical protein
VLSLVLFRKSPNRIKVNKFLNEQLSENANLLASERARTRSLEFLLQQDRIFFQRQLSQTTALLTAEKDRARNLENRARASDKEEIIDIIEAANLELVGKLVETLDLKIAELQKAAEAGVGCAKNKFDGEESKTL